MSSTFFSSSRYSLVESIDLIRSRCKEKFDLGLRSSLWMSYFKNGRTLSKGLNAYLRDSLNVLFA